MYNRGVDDLFCWGPPEDMAMGLNNKRLDDLHTTQVINILSTDGFLIVSPTFRTTAGSSDLYVL